MDNAETKERILLKARELFNRFGFRRVTMDEIALKTGMSKKTIYQSFATKDDIVDAVVEDLISKSAFTCRQNATRAENAVHEVYLNINMLQELMLDLNENVFEDLEKFFPYVFKKFFQYKNDFILSRLKDNIEQGMKEGFYRPELHVDIITRFRIETMFIPFNQNVFPFEKYNFMEVQVQTIELFLYGICTREGQKLIKKYNQQRTKN